ncbi:MAG: Holliday junction branch migration protein RuvA [Oligoflexia bacterium]|nr:Holliday junction branch migration protein RuvA [Oligoflexia bacterium]
MIGFIKGEIISSNQSNDYAIVLTSTGVGYEVYSKKLWKEGENVGIYITQIIRENTSELYAHDTIDEKFFFEMLLTVKGVGPKSAFSLIKAIAIDEIFKAIVFENSSVLKKAPGIGAKAAAQIILDLKDKISKLPKKKGEQKTTQHKIQIGIMKEKEKNTSILLEDALLALKELGLKEEDVFPIAIKVMENENQSAHIAQSSDLVRIILKEM